MSNYTVKFYKGDYFQRQQSASRDKAICYVEHHFNGGSATANYCLVNVATNASARSKRFAQSYIDRISARLGVKKAENDFADNGVSVGGYKLRGNKNLFFTACPAILLEPLFATNPVHANLIRTEPGQLALAQCLVDAIIENFPNGGLVAFSIGHKGKTSNPWDRGVELAGGGAEADFAEKVLLKAKELLEK
jgi:N-acetylmuramoyl-L-alanine amidase